MALKEMTIMLEPATQGFLDALAAQGGKPIYKLPYAEARQVLEDAQAGAVARPEVDVEDKVFPVGPAGRVAVRIFRPLGKKEQLPAVMYFHGGGWILGSKDTHDRYMREITEASGAAFVFVNYTPAPEGQYPTQIEEGYAATKYVAENAKELGFDANRLAIGGDSAGGCLSAAVTILAKERGGPALRYQLLYYPVTDSSMATASYQEFAEGPWLTKAAMTWFWDAYVPNMADREKSTAAPLKATQKELAGLPPTLVIVDENDVLRDEGEAYAKKLMRAGVAVTVVRYLATIHDFVMLNALADTLATKSAIALGAQTLKKVLA